MLARGDDPPRPPRTRAGRPDQAVPFLPLDRSGLGRVAVIGPNAEIARTLGGGSATVFPPYTVSPLDGLRAAGLDVAFAPGTLGHLRTSAARAPWLLRPDGSGPGAEVRFLSSSGELVARSSAMPPCSGG